jgi:hypothetical protein
MGLQALRSLSKLLGPYCKCIIVLSEANDVLEFGQDRDREEYVYVDAMSELEAAKMLGKLKQTFTALEQKFIFDNIGTSPVMLLDLVRKVPDRMALEDFVKNKIACARRDLVAFPHQQILLALKKNADGVGPEYFEKKMNKGVDLSDPVAVGVAMKRSNVHFDVYSSSHCS